MLRLPAGATDLASLQSLPNRLQARQSVLYSMCTAEPGGRFHRQKCPGPDTHRSPRLLRKLTH